MPSWSSFALAFLTRSDCLLAYSGLRFPSSTYFMATSTSCGSFCAKDPAIIRLLATSAHAVSPSAILEIGRANPLRKPRGPGMKCPACGAEMHLMKVAPDKPMMVPGYEEHTFECSGCHDQVRRLVFMPRPIEPLTASQCRGSRQLGSNVRPMARCQQLLGHALSGPSPESTPCTWAERSSRLGWQAQ